MKNKIFSLLVSAFLLPLLVGCNFAPQSNNNKGNTDDSSGDKSDGSSGSDDSGGQSDQPSSDVFKIKDPDTSFVQRNSKEEVTYEDLFNLNNKVEITIDVDKSEMQKINDDNVYGGDFDTIKPETYRLAKKFTLKLTNGSNTFTWELENVGIRQKGNTSRRPIFTDGGDINNRNHFKISFDETFSDKDMYDADFIAAHKNKEYKDRELLGLSGLDIKWNKVDDSTHIKEMYSNLMLRSAGIAAQRVGLGMMKMNYDGGKTADFGLCTIHEQTSKSFIKRAMNESANYINMPTWADENAGTHGIEGKKYGDLYKASYGKGDGASSGPDFTTDSISGKRLGVKTDIKGYNWPTYERKTNTGDEYNDQQMRDLVALLNNSSAKYADIEAKVDLQWLAMEEAVMYFLGNPDSMKYNYNNYQVYFRRTDGKAIILPIDNDRCFGVGNTWKSGADFIISDNCKPYTGNALNDNAQRNPLLSKTIFAGKGNQSKVDYKACIELVKQSKWVKNETFESFFNIAKKTYQGLATFSLDGGNDNISFASYMQKKLSLAGGSSDPQPDPQPQNTDVFDENGEYYAVGTFNDWGNAGNKEDYRLIYHVDDNEVRYFVCNFPVDHFYSENQFKLKISVGGYNSWTEEYGFGGTSDSLDYFKKEQYLPSVKSTDVVEGMMVRLYINVERGCYAMYPLTPNQFGFSVGYLSEEDPYLLVNDTDKVDLTINGDPIYTGTFNESMVDSDGYFTLRFVFDLEGVGPYYMTVVNDGNGGLKLVYDGHYPDIEPVKIHNDGNYTFITVSLDLPSSVVTYQLHS